MQFPPPTPLVALACLFSLITGCGPRVQEKISWNGPTDPLVKVVQDINANNSRIQTVWAQHDFEALIYDKDKARSFSGSGTIQFRKPGELLLKASGVINFFEIGSNSEHFWFTAYPDEVSTQWWGRRDSFDPSAPGAAAIPIRPDLLVEVLGVHEIDTDFVRLPVPIMRFNNDEDAYMITWNAPVARPQRWAAVKEVWYDRKTRHPRSILLFDENGRVVLRAYLFDFKKLEDSGAEMATRYDLFFPQSKSHMAFTLTTLKQYNVGKGRKYPNDSTFVLPEDPGVQKRIEIR